MYDRKEKDKFLYVRASYTKGLFDVPLMINYMKIVKCNYLFIKNWLKFYLFGYSRPYVSYMKQQQMLV